MRPTFLRLLPPLVAATLACSSADEPPVLTPVVLDLQVLDSLGTPLRGSFATWQSWPTPSVPAVSPDPLARTDTTGRWILPLGAFPDARWDSLAVHVYPRGCAIPAITTVLRRINLPNPPYDTIPLTVVTATRALSVQSVPGQYCGFAVSTSVTPRYPDVTLGLRVDSIAGGTLAGRWRVDYNWTSATEYGSFTGVQTAGTLALVLTHAAPWGACTGFTMAASLGPNGTWGPLLPTTPQGCTTAPLRFDMAPSTLITYWP